jgi:RHS repeat-associated protein
LTEANYSTGDYYRYTYDPVGNRLTEDSSVDGLPSSVAYTYDNANRLTSVDGVDYSWDANGNLLNDGVNTYTYDSANRLIEVSSQSSVTSYQYNGLGDRLTQNNVHYTLDLNAGLTQVLDDGTNTYFYGNGRIAQMGSVTEYILGDALGSVRQLTNDAAEITLTKAYEPYGEEAWSYGEGQSDYGFAAEFTDSYIKLIYLRSRMYSPGTGRFLTKDSWPGNYNRPLSLNRWNYVEGNPINLTDPSGQCYIDGGNMRRWRVWENPIDGPCEDHSGPISPDEPYWHEYRATNIVCSAWLSCTREEVVDALSRFAYPGQDYSDPVQPGELNFVEPFSWFKGTGIEYLGAIQSIIFPGELQVRNISLPTHIFHKGQVDRRAFSVGKAWYVETHGTGNNIYFMMDRVNQISGAGIFTSLDRKMRFYLETNHIKNWIEGIVC